MTARLRERAEALKPFGWKGRKAEWIALVCLHSGVFTRTQATAFLFDALGIGRGLLPVRVYRGTAGTTRRYFHVKLPVALDSERAVFVYADPGHDTATALRSWGRAHRELWRALGSLGLSVEAVVVARTSRETDRARKVMRYWTEASGTAEPDPMMARELARIERAIIEGAVEILDEYGGLQAAMQKSVALEKEARRQPRRATIHRASAWRTVRLQGVRYL